MIADALDITAQTVALAEMTGIPRNEIAEIVLTPGEVTVTRYLRNEYGSFYIVRDENDPQVGLVAHETLKFKVGKA